MRKAGSVMGVKKQSFRNFGMFLDDETGEYIKPESEDYRITIEEFFEDEEDNENLLDF